MVLNVQWEMSHVVRGPHKLRSIIISDYCYLHCVVWHYCPHPARFKLASVSGQNKFRSTKIHIFYKTSKQSEIMMILKRRCCKIYRLWGFSWGKVLPLQRSLLVRQQNTGLEIREQNPSLNFAILFGASYFWGSVFISDNFCLMKVRWLLAVHLRCFNNQYRRKEVLPQGHSFTPKTGQDGSLYGSSPVSLHISCGV